jgi:hypothetical protein
MNGYAVGVKEGCTTAFHAPSTIYHICGCYEMWCPIKIITRAVRMTGGKGAFVSAISQGASKTTGGTGSVFMSQAG